MKLFVAFALFIFHCSLLFAQQDSGKGTFHVKQKHVLDESNSIQFTYVCNGVFRNIFIDKNGNDNFNWGKQEAYTSASFSADTVTVDTIKNIITLQFISEINGCSRNDKSCRYSITLISYGIVYTANIDKDYIGKGSCGSDRLSRLVKLMDTFYNRYALSK